ncbi:hypothetical protein [Herbaspirillum seropedicae]|uniref:hypothetical protein n=1 Tax=Herbaspirillum seropedicae TaxID=964 RepID=UPI00285569D9|nr:hypothetical protein [Herbaspirillum seropedicae]MDR6397907.1 hypothetical protein [Herbaspirillum seropedicae]
MPKEPDIYIRPRVAVDAHASSAGAQTLRSSVGQLINAGNVIAVGDESGISKIFDAAKDWEEWFDGLKPEETDEVPGPT